MANKETKLRIVVDAENRSQGAFSAVQRNLDQIRSSHEGLISAMRTVGTVGAIAFGGLSLLTKGIVEAGAGFEQTQIAFETMLGSAEVAQKTLADLADFGKRTPFELGQLEEASKRLLAYGTAAEDLIPTLEMLGDITAGVGMDKLPQLILAFGQVKAATKLTGMELRQFSEAGVPLLGALVEHFNKVGKSAVTVTNAAGLTKKEIEKLGSANTKTQERLHALNITLEKQQNRMREMVRNNKDSGATWKNLKIDISETQRKIAEAEATMQQNNGTLALAGQTMTKVGQAAKVTAADIQDMVSEGKVSFADVQAALGSLTAEGGRFNDLMEKQSLTLAGMWSNLKDQISLTARAMGEELLPYLKPVVEKLIEVAQAIGEFVKQHPQLSAILLTAALGFTALLALLLPLAIALPGLVLMFQGLAAAVGLVAAALGIASAPMLLTVGLLAVIGVTAFKVAAQWQDAWDLITIAVAESANVVQSIVESMINFVIDGINTMIQKVNGLIASLAGLPMIGKQFSKLSIPELERVAFDRFDTGAIYNEMMARPRSATAGEMILNISGNTFLDEDSAEKMGDLIMQRLKMSNAI